MKLAELHIDGFGILHDYYLGPPDLGAGLTVVYGRNEAGKSTLLSFIRAILFGFKHRGEPTPEALAGGRLGGRLVLEDRRGGRYRVERMADGRKGVFRLTLPDGAEGDEKLLGGRVLQNLSYSVYKNVFAFGMEELRRLENLKQDDIAAYIYGAGTGIGPQKLAAAADRLRSEMDGLFTPGGRTVPELNRLAGELTRLEADLRALREVPARYKDLKDGLAAARERRTALLDSYRKVQAQIAFLEKLIRARRSWETLAAARAALRDLPVVESFPVSGVARLESLEEAVHQAHMARDGYREEIGLLVKELENLNPNPALSAAAGEIRDLAEQRSLLENLIAAAQEAAAAAQQSGGECATAIGNLGPGWNEERLSRLDTSIVVRQQIENHRDKLDGVRAREKLLADEARRRGDSVEKQTRLRDAAQAALEEHRVPEAPVDTPSAVRAEMLDRLEADIRRLAALHAGRNHQNERKADLTARLEASAREEQVLGPPWPGWAAPLALVFVLTVAGIGLALEPWAAVSALLIGLPVTVMVEVARRRSLARQSRARENLQRERRDLQLRLAEIEQDIARAESEAGAVAQSMREAARMALGTETAGDEEILAARRRLAEENRALQKRETLAEALAEAEGGLERELEAQRAGARELEAVRAERRTAAEEWDVWLEQAGHDPGLEPAVALSFVEAAERVRELIRVRDDRKRKAESLRDRVNELIDRADRLAAALGFEPVRTENAGHALQTMRAAAEAALAGEQRKEDLNEECERLEALIRGCDREIGRREREIGALLKAAGAADREDFRRRAEVFEKRRGLQDTVNAGERELNLLAADSAERERLDKALAAAASGEYEAQLRQARDKFDQLEREREALDQEIGEIGAKIAALETGDQLAAALQKREMLRTRLNRGAAEWQVRALALRLLESAKEKYERERQPAVLARASEYLQPMTAHRYRRVVAPVGQADKLEVERGDGARLGAAQLSRGTAAQLFLSVRLALARQLAETSRVGLPLILDDVLVDFDGPRLEGAARVLDRVAAAQQVLLFTCHRHIRDTVLRVCPRAATVELPAGIAGDVSNIDVY